jgi:HK97 family phage prohead protease
MMNRWTPAEAASLRAAQIRQVTDRPSRRRSSVEGRGAYVGASARIELRNATVESAGLSFTGIASVTERGYSMWDAFGEYEEIVSRDAFGDTLQRDGLDVPLVIGHDQLRRIARTTNDTLQLAQGPDGLEVRASLDPDDPDVQYAQTKMRQGLLDEMSFGFRIDSGSWSPDYTQYRIQAVDLHRGDVSIVGWGANPYTTGGIRSETGEDTARRLQKLRLARLDDVLAS